MCICVYMYVHVYHCPYIYIYIYIYISTCECMLSLGNVLFAKHITQKGSRNVHKGVSTTESVQIRM